MKKSRYRNKFLKDKSQTSRENYKTKKSYFESLNTKKSWMLEPSSKLLFLFSQKRRQKVKRLFLMKQKNIFLMIKKIWNFCTYFSQKNTHRLSTIIETFEKYPSTLNIRKGNLDSVFSLKKTTQEEVSKVLRDLTTKNVVRRVTLPLNMDVALKNN